MAVQVMLQSWKEISKFVGRTERTIQRWEQEFGFPVHRPSGKSRSAVMALTQEIQEWTRGKPSLVLIRRTPRLERARFTAASDERNSRNDPRSAFSLDRDMQPSGQSFRAQWLLDSTVARKQLSGALCETQRNLQALKTLLREQQSLHARLRETRQRRFFA